MSVCAAEWVFSLRCGGTRSCWLDCDWTELFLLREGEKKGEINERWIWWRRVRRRIWNSGNDQKQHCHDWWLKLFFSFVYNPDWTFHTDNKSLQQDKMFSTWQRRRKKSRRFYGTFLFFRSSLTSHGLEELQPHLAAFKYCSGSQKKQKNKTKGRSANVRKKEQTSKRKLMSSVSIRFQIKSEFYNQ